MIRFKVSSLAAWISNCHQLGILFT